MVLIDDVEDIIDRALILSGHGEGAVEMMKIGKVDNSHFKAGTPPLVAGVEQWLVFSQKVFKSFELAMGVIGIDQVEFRKVGCIENSPWTGQVIV